MVHSNNYHDILWLLVVYNATLFPTNSHQTSRLLTNVTKTSDNNSVHSTTCPAAPPPVGVGVIEVVAVATVMVLVLVPGWFAEVMPWLEDC